jgi:HEAT repeat protein
MIPPLPAVALLLTLGADPSGPVCAAPAACGSAAPAALDRIAPLMGLIDGPVTPAMWSALPPEVLPMLEAMAAGPGRAGQRARALEGAAALGSDGALHRRLAGDRAEPLSVRVAAIHGLGRIVAPSRLKAELAPFLEGDPDLRIRSTAAAALARSAPAAACVTIRARVQRERAEERPAYGPALSACGGP